MPSRKDDDVMSYTFEEICKLFEDGRSGELPEKLWQYVEDRGDLFESDYYETREECEAEMEREIRLTNQSGLTPSELDRIRYDIKDYRPHEDYDELFDMINDWIDARSEE